MHHYLESIGVLDCGSGLDIAQARKEYRKLYLAHYHKNYSNTHTDITVSFTKKQIKILQDSAKVSSKRLAPFIKETVFYSIVGDVPSSEFQKEKLSKLDELFSLSFDIVEELQFEYPELNQELGKILQLHIQIQSVFKEI